MRQEVTFNLRSNIELAQSGLSSNLLRLSAGPSNLQEPPIPQLSYSLPRPRKYIVIRHSNIEVNGLITTNFSALPDQARKPATDNDMGGQVSRIMGKIFASREMRLLMLGLDAAGKTSTFTLQTSACTICGDPSEPPLVSKG